MCMEARANMTVGGAARKRERYMLALAPICVYDSDNE